MFVFRSFSGAASHRTYVCSFPFPALLAAAKRQRQCFRIALIAACAIAGPFAGPNTAVAQPPTFARGTVQPTSELIARSIAEAAARFGLPASWIRAVLHAESIGAVRAVSPKGAMGLMQIMPATWSELRAQLHLGADPFDVHDNIIAGAAYLRELHERYGSPGFLAAYNAGPARWEAYLATRRALPAETRAYLAKLVPTVTLDTSNDDTLLTSVARSWTSAPLFPARSGVSALTSRDTGRAEAPTSGDRNAAADWTALAPQNGGLFVALAPDRKSP